MLLRRLRVTPDGRTGRGPAGSSACSRVGVGSPQSQSVRALWAPVGARSSLWWTCCARAILWWCQGLAVCPGKVMDSRGEMEVVRSTKGSAAGEVSVHVVTTESTVQSTHLPTTAFIIPANATAINLPTSTLEIQRFPREPQRSTGPEKPDRGAGNEPITAAVIPQISGVQTCSTVRVLEWKDGVATLPGSNLRFRINEYGTLKVVSADKMPPVEAVKEGHTEKDGDSEVAPPSRDNPTVAQDVPEQPTAEGLCHCDTCGRRHVWDGAREGRGFCSEHCHQQFKERSVIVENSASSTNVTEILKPVKKRKRKDYQSPSEEEYESEQMEEKQDEKKSSVEDSAMSNLEAEAWNRSQHVPSSFPAQEWL